MSDPIEVSYKNNGCYRVVVTEDYSDLSQYIRELFPGLVRICIISDTNVSKLYLDTVKAALSDCCETMYDLVFEAGEQSKCLDTVKRCYDRLLECGFNRKDLVIGLGGGVCGDLSAFVASTYMRGCRFVNLPTSLLSMADSSVGGKCGVDYEMYKNLIGQVYMPDLVYAAVNVLSTLPEREFSSGMAEILKAGLIKDAAFYEWLIENFDHIMDRESAYLVKMLETAISIKKFFVTRDPFEEGERMILNFGHTIGHALEKYFDFRYSHGECVALGMVAASKISHSRSMLSDEEFYEIRDMFVPFGLPISLDAYDTDSVIDNISHDKKNTDTGLSFILLKKPGKALIVKDVSPEELKEACGCLIVEWD